jgi:SOS-response transcriptional repressor LexA
MTERTIDVEVPGRRGRYGLTPGLQRLYLAIVALIDARGVAPTLVEIADAGGYSHRSEVMVGVRALRERGWLDYRARRPRTIVLSAPVLRHLKPAAEEAVP